MGYSSILTSNIKPWPDSSSQHELRSIRQALSISDYTPDELRITEIEKAFRRPMIQLTMLNQRVENRSKFDFSMIKNIACTYFGSTTEMLDADQRHFEALQVSDFLAEFFGRANTVGIHGPALPIYDFSEDEPFLTPDWIHIDVATAELTKDEFGLWMVPMDIRYGVSRDEVSIDPDPEVIILNYNRRIEIG